MQVRKAEPREAAAQAVWIAAIDPWRSLGYTAGGLAEWLRKMARAERVQVAVDGATDTIMGIIVVTPDVLLGDFIALVAARTLGSGVGRALVEHAANHSDRRWLYTSSDATNRPAAAFYRKLGFSRVGRLPDLVRPGRDELLWRRALSPPEPVAAARPAARRARAARRSPARQRA